jgi:ribonuclease Z
MLPGQLAAHGISGPDVGELLRAGSLRGVALDEVSEPRPGQRFAFIMDTRLCDAAFELARGSDLLVCESTFASAEEALATEYGHLTARQAGRIAAESGARSLVLTHFSQRYEHGDESRLLAEAAEEFGGEITLVSDLDVVPVPARR